MAISSYKSFSKKKRIPKGSAKSLAITNYKTLSSIKKKLHSETKYFHTGTSISLDRTASITTLCAPANGITNEQRTGDQITVKTLKINAVLGYQALNATVRIIVFRDKQNQIGSQGDILYSSIPNIYTPIEFFAKDKAKRYTILVDKTVIVHTYDPLKHFRINIVGLNSPIVFDGTSVNINSGALKIMVVSDTDLAAATPDKPIIKWTSEVTYTDS